MKTRRRAGFSLRLRLKLALQPASGPGLKPRLQAKACSTKVVALAIALSVASFGQTLALRAGAAKVDVTPAEKDLRKTYAGILDHLYSRAIVVDNGTASGSYLADADGIADPLWQSVTKKLGDITIGAVNAEVFNLIAQRLKKKSPYTRTMMATLTKGSAGSGFNPNDAAYGMYTFEVVSSRLKPGCAEFAIVNGILDLMAEVQH